MKHSLKEVLRNVETWFEVQEWRSNSLRQNVWSPAPEAGLRAPESSPADSVSTSPGRDRHLPGLTLLALD